MSVCQLTLTNTLSVFSFKELCRSCKLDMENFWRSTVLGKLWFGFFPHISFSPLSVCLSVKPRKGSTGHKHRLEASAHGKCRLCSVLQSSPVCGSDGHTYSSKVRLQFSSMSLQNPHSSSLSISLSLYLFLSFSLSLPPSSSLRWLGSQLLSIIHCVFSDESLGRIALRNTTVCADLQSCIIYSVNTWNSTLSLPSLTVFLFIHKCDLFPPPCLLSLSTSLFFSLTCAFEVYK